MLGNNDFVWQAGRPETASAPASAPGSGWFDPKVPVEPPVATPEELAEAVEGQVRVCIKVAVYVDGVFLEEQTVTINEHDLKRYTFGPTALVRARASLAMEQAIMRVSREVDSDWSGPRRP